MPLFFQLCRLRPLRALLIAAFGLAALGLCFLTLSPAASAQAPDPVPAISGISPSSAVSGGPPVTLTVSGTGFASNSVIYWNGQFLRPTLVTDPNLPPRLVVTLYPSLMTDIGAFPVTVVNPTPGGGTSNTVTFQVIASVPEISVLSPRGAVVGSKNVVLRVNGTGFFSTSVVEWNGQPLPTTLVTGGPFGPQLAASVSDALVASLGTAAITVVTPAPGGGTSNAHSFQIIPPIPTPVLTALSPSHVTEGGPDFLLTVTGTGFDGTSRIHISVYPYSLQGLPTTLVSPTQITAMIPATTVASHFSQAIQVLNGVAGINYIPSNSLTLTMDTPPYPVPTLTALSPGSVRAGSGGFLLQLTGTGFNQDMTVTFGSDRLSGSLVTAGMNVFIPDADVPAAGTVTVPVTVPVTVISPSSGPGFGGTSNALTFTFTASLNPLPIVTGLSPASAVQGDPDLTITVKGSSLLPISQVNWNGAPLVSTFVSATQMTAVAPAALLAAYGTATVSVTTPAPGGGAAAYAPPFLVTPHPNPVPTISALTPDHCTSDAGGCLVHITGTNIVPGASATVNGAPSRAVAGTVTGTGFDIVLGYSDLQTPGTLQIAVVNPPNAGDGPPGSGAGGGTSGTLPFTVTPPENPVPSVTKFAPAGGVPAGGGGFSLRVYGRNFVRGATVAFGKDKGLVPSADTFNDGTMDVLIPAADIAQPGAALVTVTNPPGGGGGGGDSAAMVFPITAPLSPAPTLSALSPSAALVGGPAFTLTVMGLNFAQSSQVRWNGVTLVTTFVSDARLTATVPAALLALPSGVFVSVSTPAPGGGSTSSLPFAISQTLPHTHLLWNNTDGRVMLWSIAPDGAFTLHGFGPYYDDIPQHTWSATALATGKDGVSHLLWNNTDGRVMLWTVDDAGNFTLAGYGPYTDDTPDHKWYATAVSVGPDNVTHLLWNNTDRRVMLWSVQPDFSFTLAGYGPYTDQTPSQLWSATALATGPDNVSRIAWNNTDGRVMLWDIQPDFSFTLAGYGPYVDQAPDQLWAASGVATGPDGLSHLLWGNTDRRAMLWGVSNAFDFSVAGYGPYTDQNAGQLWSVTAVSAGP